MKLSTILFWITLASGAVFMLSACAADEGKGLCSYLGGCGDDDDDSEKEPAPAPTHHHGSPDHGGVIMQ